MKPIWALLGISGAATILLFGVILVDAFTIAQVEAASGSSGVIGDFLIVGVLAIVAVTILGLVSGLR